MNILAWDNKKKVKKKKIKRGRKTQVILEKRIKMDKGHHKAKGKDK